MKNKNYLISSFFCAVLVGILLTGCSDSLKGDLTSSKKVRKIVVFDSSFVNEKAKDNLLKNTGGTKIKNLKLINGMAVYLPSKAAEKALKTRAEVLRIDEDITVSINKKGGNGGGGKGGGKQPPSQPEEVLPWGIHQIGADSVWNSVTGAGIKVAVIDTGIDFSHPDLQANVWGGYNSISTRKSPKDDNGHGTHVAGTIAAIDNEIGVIGVGPQIELYAVKALDRKGSGYLSDVIEALQWSVTNGMQVVNLSLSADSHVQSFRDAVAQATQSGLVIVAASGNDGTTVDYPAAYTEVIAVSATDDQNNLASFSNRGDELDLVAPGVNIFSTTKGGEYSIESGTSMAAPHVTGAVALVLNTLPGEYDTNENGTWDPTEVQKKLEDTALDLGTAGKDPDFGSGLVDVIGATA